MDKMLILAWWCYILAVAHAHMDLETNLLSFQRHSKQRNIEAVKDNYVKKLFTQMLGRKLSVSSKKVVLQVEKQNGGLSRLEDPNAEGSRSDPAVFDAMILHRELQNRLGWGSDDNGPSKPNQNYGPPPNQQYGAPPPPNYGPPNQPPNQNYGPPNQPPNQNYGPPNQPPNQNYGPPNQPPSQNYGPPNQQYGAPPPPSPNGKNNIRVNNAMIGGHIENFKLSDAIKTRNPATPSDQYGGPPPPPPRPDDQYGPPPSQYGPPPRPNDQYGPPSSNDIGGYEDNAKIIKHVYIHTPPAETEVAQKPRVIRPNQKQDTHYQIIFVKAPTPKQQQTEIELPPPPERKTLVYLLLKKEKQAEIKIKSPPPTKISKPEVYFIRYKGAQNGQQQDGYSSTGSTKDFGPSLNSEDGHYSNSYNAPSQALDGMRPLDRPPASITSSQVRDSVGYPNTEYRAPISMLSPNQEPMSIAVYDRIRNGVMPSNTAGNRRGSLVAASSEISPRTARVQHQQGSHYTAPGSKPFVKASGKMVAGHYVGMSSNVLRDYYSPESHKYADN